VTAPTAADYERGRTWALTIAAELLRKDGAAAPFHDKGKEHCWASGFRSVGNQPPGTGSRPTRGGLSATSLIGFLRPDYTREDTLAWVARFSAQTPASGGSKPRTKSGPRRDARPSQRFAETVSTPEKVHTAGQPWSDLQNLPRAPRSRSRANALDPKRGPAEARWSCR